MREFLVITLGAAIAVAVYLWIQNSTSETGATATAVEDKQTALRSATTHPIERMEATELLTPETVQPNYDPNSAPASDSPTVYVSPEDPVYQESTERVNIGPWLDPDDESTWHDPDPPEVRNLGPNVDPDDPYG